MATRKRRTKKKTATKKARRRPRMSRALAMEMMEGYADSDLQGIRGARKIQKDRRDLYEAAARGDKRTLSAIMAQKARGLSKRPRGNAPDRYTITGRASGRGKPGGLVLTLAKTGSKTCAIRDANRAARYGYKNIKIYDDYAKKTVAWRGK